MSLLRSLICGFGALFRKQRTERDVDEELHAYLDAAVKDNLRSGMSREDALRAARVEVGSMEAVKEAIRGTGWERAVEMVGQDLRYAVRMLRKSPGFSVVAILTLALGIGANTAIFSVIDAVLLSPLPYQNAGRLVMLWEQNPDRGWFHNIVSAANFVDWRKQNHVFTQMAAIDAPSYDVSGTGEPMEVQGEQVSADFFSVLGARAALGRTFVPEEDQPKSSRVVVLSDEIWKQRYGANPGLVGHTIRLNRVPYTVIGVMRPGFYFPPWDDRAQLWTAGLDLTRPDRTWHEYMCIARLKPGAGFERAQAEIDTIAARLGQQYPEQKGWGVQLVNLHDQVVGNTRPALLVLLGAVGLVLLIACANVANLQLARIASREKEIALRTALGAGRGRVIRQLLSESVLLAMAGGAFGLLLAGWGVQLLVMLAPQGTPGLDRAGVNLEVLVFTFAISVATGIAFGLVPALGASKVDLSKSLKEGGRSSAEGIRSQRARALLVSSEFALALVLSVGAGLLIKSFVALSKVDLGFEPHNVLTMRIALLGPGYRDRNRQVEFFRELLRSV
ncbi:MAG TPA: ABC transporter permease, partial [Terriglobia bacterium]|nr:ABC transporter permease [Terriglobia bacterium]